ncbi:uncharacterized protein LOC101845973 [Aplysia californica]|uniref:Uncharacterized protein LOC101845973 n=1 Tax=Aplysia californica TaxID=6500 RepID=A0ABM1ADV5_APLCA|nr:uncharacterized protein LOC101845973 [Aplysia californica]
MMTSKGQMPSPRHWLVCLMVLGAGLATAQKTYDMDEFATCGRTVIVDDSGVRLQGRGNTSPSNPPMECTVHLLSTYREEDGTNKLQVEVEFLKIEDCSVNLDLFNGHRAGANYLQKLGCRSGSTDTHYSTGREITARFTRPDRLIHNEYQFILLFKPFEDRNAVGTNKRVDKLSVGAIIGISLGCLLLVALIILFCWCCCTGRVGRFSVPGWRRNSSPIHKSDDLSRSGLGPGTGSKRGAIDFQDPVVWSTVTTGKYEPGPKAPRNYQNGIPRNNMRIGRQFEREATQQRGQTNSWNNRLSGHDYEPYDVEEDSRRAGQNNGRWKPKKETNIDDVFETDSNASKDTEQTEATVDDATLQKRPLGKEGEGSPKSKRKGDVEIPEEQELEKNSPQLQRYLSMDMSSQPDLDTISSQLHINAGVRARVDDDGSSPSGSLRKKKKGEKSPLSRRRGDGREPDPTVLPPEAFEPIFTKPITGIDYPANRNQNPYGQMAGYPGGFVPYGLIPAGAFMPGPPGTQTYAYAYQTPPQHPGAPGQQGAWVVQNMPTTDGNRRTAFAVEQTISPDGRVKMSTPERRRKHSDQFRRTGNRGSWGSTTRGPDGNRAPDLSVVARGAAPPDPGQGHRSIEMKSGTDPDSGIHTTQVVWRDTVPDATDPKPEDNPQITRKTVTRVTTKSGYGELPPSTALLSGEEDEPAFLSPSGNSRDFMNTTPQHRNALPAASTPATENLAFYTGSNPTVPPPERSSTPTSTHNHPTYNAAIRDRIPIDSTV